MSVLEWLIPPPPTEDERSFWSSVREALKGSHQDYTTGNLNRAILLLAIPMVLEMVLESLFAVTDVFWVGRLGANAVATVGITESMLALVFAIGLGVSMSTTAMVARRIGEKDPEGEYRPEYVEKILKAARETEGSVMFEDVDAFFAKRKKK